MRRHEATVAFGERVGQRLIVYADVEIFARQVRLLDVQPPAELLLDHAGRPSGGRGARGPTGVSRCICQCVGAGMA